MADLDGLPDKRWSLRGITEEGDEAWLIRGDLAQALPLPRLPRRDRDRQRARRRPVRLPARRHRTPSLAPALRRRAADRGAARRCSGSRRPNRRRRGCSTAAATRPGAGATVEVSRRAELASVYIRIGRTYIRWAPSLLLLAVVVFVPLGLLHAVAINAEIGSFGLQQWPQARRRRSGGAGARPRPA